MWRGGGGTAKPRVGLLFQSRRSVPSYLRSFWSANKVRRYNSFLFGWNDVCVISKCGNRKFTNSQCCVVRLSWNFVYIYKLFWNCGNLCLLITVLANPSVWMFFSIQYILFSDYCVYARSREHERTSCIHAIQPFK